MQKNKYICIYFYLNNIYIMNYESGFGPIAEIRNTKNKK